MKRVRQNLILPLLLLAISCAGQRQDAADLEAEIAAVGAQYDEIGLYVATELAGIEQIRQTGQELTAEQKQRALDLYDVLTELDAYRNAIEALKIDPTVELMQSAVDTWNSIKAKAIVLGWGGLT